MRHGSGVDLVALGRRIKELRGEMSMGAAATRAAISVQYWSAVEAAQPGKNGEPVRVSAPVLRSMADAIEADRVELLELAGHDEAAAWDRVLAARQQRGATTEGRPSLAALNADLVHLDEEAVEAVHVIVKQIHDAQRREP